MVCWFVFVFSPFHPLNESNSFEREYFLYTLQMFGNIKVDHSSTIHNHNNFQTIFQATLVLFRQEGSANRSIVALYLSLLFARMEFRFIL